MSALSLYTIGHSNRSFDHLVDRLQRHGIEVLIDVRSAPYSQYAPQFNRESLQAVLPSRDVRYVYAGQYLGGRPPDPGCYDPEGKIDYQVVERRRFYRVGIARLLEYVRENRVAIMCSEENPNQCHRHKLISQSVLDFGIEVTHIRGAGELEPARRLPRQAKLFE